MRILFLGDVIGRSGRDGLARVLPEWRQAHEPDLIIINAENAAHGKGLTPKTAAELWALGADVLTLGNHTFDRKEIRPLLDDPRLLRPANMPEGVPGRGAGVYASRAGVPVGVIQVMGRVHMQLSDCPFRALDREIERLRRETPVLFVDLHVEATSESVALGWYVDGRVSAAIGSHTHVQTADERILPGGTAYLTDAGACGPRDSVIGLSIPAAMDRFLTGIHQPFEVARGDALICGCLVTVDPATGKAERIERLQDVVECPASQAETA